LTSVGSGDNFSLKAEREGRMYRVAVHDHFSSAHQLKGYRGKCEDVHGHNWKVELEVEGETLDHIGMLVDFRMMKDILKNVIDELDHRMLNEIEPFNKINPSSELLAQHIFQKVRNALGAGVKVYSISVWESENSRAVYFERKS
jgi:6-pyruvoyltetrahydropterin/6-carboxytetrahydropterin synthase